MIHTIADSFLDIIWRIFHVNVPGTDFTFAQLYIAVFIIGILSFVLHVILRIDRVGGAYRRGKSAYDKRQKARSKGE